MASTLQELEEVALRIEGVSDQLGMLHDVAAESGQSLDNYTIGIWLISDTIFKCSNELNEIINKLFKERTK